jgi:hypothetical protein
MTLLLLPPSELISSVPKLNEKKTLTERDSRTYLHWNKLRMQEKERDEAELMIAIVCERNASGLFFIVYRGLFPSADFGSENSRG